MGRYHEKLENYKKSLPSSGYQYVDIDSLYIPYPNSLYNSEKIESNTYLLNMKEAIRFLPPIVVIDLGDVYSLSDGYHRVSIYKYLGLKQIKAEVY